MPSNGAFFIPPVLGYFEITFELTRIEITAIQAFQKRCILVISGFLRFSAEIFVVKRSF